MSEDHQSNGTRGEKQKYAATYAFTIAGLLFFIYWMGGLWYVDRFMQDCKARTTADLVAMRDADHVEPIVVTVSTGLVSFTGLCGCHSMPANE